tara:strand:+ start:3442 stop:4140 length:699 start_codon:yes stop_codon:yes gene_type:complete
MIRLSIALMHTPAFIGRRHHVEYMINKISVRTIQQEVEDFKIFADWYQKGVWYNARQCWMWGLSTKCTHHLVIQDDVELCEQFIQTVKKCIETYPEHPLGLYANRKICEEAKNQDIRWCQIPDGTWGQAIVLPQSMIAKFLKWEKNHILPNFKWDDSRLAMFLVDQKIPAMCPMPSLVNHAGADSSIVGNNNKNRKARWFVENKNYLDYNWSDKKFLKSPSALSKEYYKYYV